MLEMQFMICYFTVKSEVLGQSSGIMVKASVGGLAYKMGYYNSPDFSMKQ